MCRDLFRPVMLVCAVMAMSACQPQRPGIQGGAADGLAGMVESAGAMPIGGTAVIYFGELFSKEEALLAAKPTESVVPPSF